MKISEVLTRLKKRISWNDLNDRPSSFPPSKHNHKSTEVTITGGKTLQQAIDDGDIGGNSVGSAWPIILDSTTHKTGTGKVTADTFADNGYCISLSGSSTAVITFLKTDSVKLGKYGISLRAKVSNNSLSQNILKVEVIKINSSNEQVIKTINFTGSDFESTSKYCWLTSFFDYSLEKKPGDEIGIRVSIGASLGTSVDIKIDYISILPLMSAQYVMG